jgi:hypothetical protein
MPFGLYATSWNSFVKKSPIMITRNMNRSPYEETKLPRQLDLFPHPWLKVEALFTHYIEKAEDIRSHWNTFVNPWVNG